MQVDLYFMLGLFVLILDALIAEYKVYLAFELKRKKKQVFVKQFKKTCR